MNFKFWVPIVLYFFTTSVASSTAKTYKMEDIAKRNTPENCWMVVDGAVYDLSSYLPEHQKYTNLLPGLCGKDGSHEWHHKGHVKKPHSKKAALVLKK